MGQEGRLQMEFGWLMCLCHDKEITPGFGGRPPAGAGLEARMGALGPGTWAIGRWGLP